MYRIRHMGCDAVHSKDFRLTRPNGFETYLALYVRSQAYFTLNGAEIRTEPDMFILYDKRKPISYRCCGERYVNDWIEFESDEIPAIEFARPYYFSQRIPVSSYTHLICDAYYRRSEKACSQLMSAFFSEISLISGDPGGSGTHYRELTDMRMQIYMTPERDWSVPKMAKSLHISPAYLQELYKSTFGVSCRADVISSRIEAAKTLLDGTTLSVAEVGYRCGYNSPVHFSRQFSAVTGMSPSKWKSRR